MSLVAYLDDEYERPADLLWPRRRSSPLTLPSVRRPSSNAATTNDLALERRWLNPVLESLGQLVSLQPGWGGPGTPAIDANTLRTALFVMTTIAQPNTKPPGIVPMADGRLQVVWYDAGLEFEIVIGSDGDATASLFDLVTGIEEDALSVSDPRVAEAIKRLSST